MGNDVEKTLVASALVLLLGTTAAVAQQQTGEIFGRAADKSGAVLPGATVTVAGPALIQPRVAVTSETGTYRVPELPIGTYSVTFELAGFRTMAMQDIRVTIGFRAQVNGALELSTVQETVTVTGESPLVDTRETGTKTTFDLETMQNIPSARDPWVMLERTPGITMDRANVGGNQSGQQSGYISRGAIDRQQQVVDRRRRHHRHGRDRRVADLLRLRHARGNAGHHGRRGRRRSRPAASASTS